LLTDVNGWLTIVLYFFKYKTINEILEYSSHWAIIILNLLATTPDRLVHTHPGLRHLILKNKVQGAKGDIIQQAVRLARSPPGLTIAKSPLLLSAYLLARLNPGRAGSLRNSQTAKSTYGKIAAKDGRGPAK